jgi:glycosyltransferase involved in cell wall biosynthesis
LLTQACRAAGIEMVECHQPLWEKTPHKHAAYFGARSAITLATHYAASAIALARRRRHLGNVSLYVIGFGGQLDCLWLSLLLRRRRTPIVLAPLVTLSETLIEDRGVFPPGSLRARAAAWVDRVSLGLATRVIIDTEAHRRYLTATFGIPPARVSTWHLGTDPGVFARTPLAAETSPLRVLFYSSFLPLHGVATVLRAAALLEARDDIEFVLLGDGPERAAAVAYVRETGLTAVRFEDWEPYQSLPAVIAQAHICLGIFGSSAKAQMVIPNKLYEAAAAGRPIITGDTAAVREVYAHGESIWLCPPADPAALAAAIDQLARDPAARGRLAAGAAAVMEERFAPAAQGERLAAIFAAVSAAA